MKILLAAAPLLLWPIASLDAAAPAATAALACNVTASVIDPDPAGANVRKVPGGGVAATLRAPREGDDWIEVHVVAQAGDWFAIDRADLVGDARKTIFRGKGYMHRSVLGAGGLINGEPIRSAPDADSPRILASEEGDQQVHLLACSGAFMNVRVKGGVGWTKALCLNQRTTCA
jgi:hypothetical protein